MSNGLQALANYTWSHSIDIASSDAAVQVGVDKVDPRVDRGSSDFDIRHVLSGAVSCDIPALRFGKLGNIILRNWSADSIFVTRSATPVNVITGTVVFGVVGVVRPDLIPGVPLYVDNPAVAGGRRINRAAFSIPATQRQGSLGRNSLRGFSFSQVDLAVRRRFKLTEKVDLQLRTEFFNIFNHPNFADPVNNLQSGTFGQSTSMLGRSLGAGGINGGLSPLYQVGGPRSIQLALKLMW